MAISESKTQKRFRFYLQNASQGLLLLRYTPDGWEDSKFELKRNPVYNGLFRTITFNQLVFKKDSRDFIRDVYEGQGINGAISFMVQRLSDTTGLYVDYFVGKLDLSTYKIDETGVTCQVVDTSFAEKVKNRESIKVNLRERISIEGYEIPAFSDEDPQLSIPDYEITARATWGDRAVNFNSTLDNHYVPLWEGISEFTETQSQDPDIPIADDGGMFINSLSDRSIHISGHISGRCDFSTMLPHVTFTIKIYVAGVAVHTILTVTGNNVNQLIFSADFVDDINVLTGEDFWIQATLDHSGTTTYDSDINVSISQVLSSVTGTAPVAYPFYEAFLRCLQLITDSNDVLKSDYFGRTDSEVVTYASDGQLGHLTKGLFIRSAEGLNNAMAISLQDLFKSLSSVFCLGMGIEDVSGTDKVIVDELSYFFSSTVIADLSARVREEAIGKEVLPEKHYNKLSVGYNTFEYLTNGGLAEYNTRSEFTTVLSSVDNGLDLVSKYRADTQGIVKLMQGVASDEDIKGDEDIFIIDSIRQIAPLTGFKARTDEDFILVTGGADAENCYNLDYTPKRNLIRNGLLIRACLQKNLGTYIRWQSSDKNNTLQTQRTAEADPIVENADVLVNDLEEPFFLPEVYTFECVMKYADLSAILANPKGLIKLSDTKYGWIMSLVIGNKENKASLQLLRANLNVITPV